ncbi:nitrate reductase molybdenum cofactor assembly chaperone [Actinoplanes sp. CA-131856]
MNARAWQSQSLLLGYPDSALLERLDLLASVASTLDRSTGAPLLRFVEHARNTPPVQLAADYVATFDQRKRCCLYLTYYAYGDTRNRGMALLKLKQAYAADGLILGDDELSDHLSVVLEYAAAVPDKGRALLADHRAGLELLRLALRDMRSPWADVLESVSATLPPLRSMSEVAKLAAQGPPEEKVGTYR